MENEQINEVEAEMESFSLVESHPIELRLFSKKTSKTYNLLYGSGKQEPIKGQHKNYSFELEVEIYVVSVFVETEGYSSIDYAEYGYTDATGAYFDSKVRNNDGSFEFEVNSFIKNFTFKPSRRYSGDPKILRVTFYGYTKSEFREVCDAIYDFDSYKLKAEKILEKVRHRLEEVKEQQSIAEEKIDSYNEKLATLETESSSYLKDIEFLKNDRESLKDKIEELRAQDASLSAKLEQSGDLLDRKREEHKQLNADVAEKTAKLKSLREDINLFPSEIGAFVEQAAKNIYGYTLLSMLPIFGMLLVILALFSNAADLTVIYKEEEGVSVWTIFLTRLPYVMIAVTIVHACYRIAKVFISEILKINQQKLNLSKISIIATDVSKASEEGLELDDDDLYQLRTQLKMELLREHLKEYINDSYKYKVKKNVEKKAAHDEVNPDSIEADGESEVN
ncbi:MAG: hypothetical protein GYB38_05990 [Gammaproteobacteria bacterium]|nr:hypothetical protein [Gammaproteobacteria bacterium]